MMAFSSYSVCLATRAGSPSLVHCAVVFVLSCIFVRVVCRVWVWVFL